MPHKITLIASAVCLTFISVWYLGFVPESLVPLLFVIVVFIGLHVVIDLLMAAWEAAYKRIRNK